MYAHFEKSKQRVCNFQSYELSIINNYYYSRQWEKVGRNYAIDLNSSTLVAWPLKTWNFDRESRIQEGGSVLLGRGRGRGRNPH